ncbi:MAG: Fic family protein [Succinivibrio sp.]|nr:Fic family protein [Succinivibrio sp.]
MTYAPPFHYTDEIACLLASVCEALGSFEAHCGSPGEHLRRACRIRAIHASLAIEQNPLSLDEVTAALNGRRVQREPVKVREVQNAGAAYEMMPALDPGSVSDLLRAHQAMMQGLISENGKFRSGAVGVFSGTAMIHLAPPARLVPGEIRDLFEWYQNSPMHPLIKSAIFHYEFEFIHPFADGNGRMGRMWHSLLLGKWKKIFFWLPVEEFIRKHQQEYYDALGKSDYDADSSAFAELLLQCVLEALKAIPKVRSGGERELPVPVARLLRSLGDEPLSAVELMARLGLSHRPTFRQNYLRPALKLGVIGMTIPDKPNSRKQRYLKKL